MQGNIDYSNNKKRYGGALKRIRKLCSQSKKIQEILNKIREKKNLIIIGDFNTGLKIDSEGAMFKCSEYMETLINIGWTDAWRKIHGIKLDYTWFSNTGNGFRIDYTFLSKSIQDNLVDAYYSHDERINKSFIKAKAL